MQLASEISELHARHPGCGFNRSLVVHLDLSTSSVVLARHAYIMHTPCMHHAYTMHNTIHLDLPRARLAARGLPPTPGRHRSSAAANPTAIDPSTDPAAAAAAAAADPGVRVRLVRGSLLDLSSLELGRFDYVNCVGVTHHLPDPAAALRGLAKHALAPGGGLGLMVYGTLGRGGVYETQALRLLHAKGSSPF